jgi:microcompartment protein CcmK/EutM
MRICRVIGTVVGAAHHPVYDGQKLMVVQRLDEQGRDTGESFLAVDRVQAGPGDRVVVMSEGNGVRQVLDMGQQVPIRSIIIGIVDQVDVG